MKLVDVITVVQLLLGAPLVLFAILKCLQMRKKASKDLQGKWLAVIFFMAFFLFCDLLIVFTLLFKLALPSEMFIGSVFLIGACFAYVAIRTAIRHNTVQDRELSRYAEKMAKSISSLKEVNEELEQEIARRQLPEEELRRSEEKYSSLVESTEDSIYLIDRNCCYLFMNKKHLSRLGISEEGYAGKGYSDFHTPEETRLFTGIAEEVFRTGTSARFEHKSRRDREYFLLTLSPVIKPNGEISAVTVVSKNISELKKMEAELRTLSFTDPLTGLHNRRGFLTLGDHLIKTADRTRSKVFLLYADMDYLKNINDAFGHQEGDIALKETGRILKENFRRSDIVARIGGDEFVVMPVGNKEESIPLLTARLADKLRDYNAKKLHKHTLSLSIGITHYDPEQPVSLEELLSRADKMMYEQKIAKKES